MPWFGSRRRDARAQAARSDPLPVGGIVRLSVGRHRGKLGVRCVRMGSRAADESAATEGARPDDGGHDDSGSEVDAWASSARRSPHAGPGRPPPTVAQPAATRQGPPHPSRTGVQRGGFLAVCTVATHKCSRRSPQISAGADPKRRLFTVALSETLRVTTPPAPRSSQVVQNQRRMVQTRSHPPGGPENKTQPKAPLPQEGFGMNIKPRSD